MFLRTALGWLRECCLSKSRFYMLLPGPPSELQPMFENEAKPLILGKLGSREKIVSRVLRFFGIGESQLETDLEDLNRCSDKSNNCSSCGRRGSHTQAHGKACGSKENKPLVKRNGRPNFRRVGEFFYGYDDTSLAEKLRRHARTRENSGCG